MREYPLVANQFKSKEIKKLHKVPDNGHFYMYNKKKIILLSKRGEQWYLLSADCLEKIFLTILNINI